MSKTTSFNFSPANTNRSSNLYIWGMSSAAATATISITGPNGRTWHFTTEDLYQGQAFNLPNPGNTSSVCHAPYAHVATQNLTKDVSVTISSTANGSNEGIKTFANTSDTGTVLMQTVIYNDPSNVDNDYNDVVLSFAIFQNEVGSANPVITCPS